MIIRINETLGQCDKSSDTFHLNDKLLQNILTFKGLKLSLQARKTCFGSWDEEIPDLLSFGEGTQRLGYTLTPSSFFSTKAFELSVLAGADPFPLELYFLYLFSVLTCSYPGRGLGADAEVWAGQPGCSALNYRAITVIFTLGIYKWKFFSREEYSHVTQQVGNRGCEGNCIKFCSYNMISLLIMKCNQPGI